MVALQHIVVLVNSDRNIHLLNADEFIYDRNVAFDLQAKHCYLTASAPCRCRRTAELRFNQRFLSIAPTGEKVKSLVMSIPLPRERILLTTANAFIAGG